MPPTSVRSPTGQFVKAPTKPKIVCVYVFRGNEVLRREEDKHPGMDSFELPDHEHSKRDTKVMFHWDHITPKGEHVFLGVEIRTAPVVTKKDSEKV